MNLFKKLLCVCLALVLALGSAACVPGPGSDPTTGATSPASTAPSTTASTSPTLPEEPAALYAFALEGLEQLRGLSMEQTLSREVTAGGETFLSEERHIVTYQGLGTESLTASVSGSLTYDGEAAEIKEIFADGVAYVHLLNEEGEQLFRSEITAEAFTARYLPSALLDAALYGSLTVSQTDGGFTLSFTDASTPESWLGLPAEAIVQKASGTASLDASGRLTGSDYEISYTVAGVSYTVSAQQTVGDAGTVESAPSDSGKYLLLGHPDVPRWFVRAVGHLKQTQTISSHTSKLILTAAGGLALITSTDNHMFRSGDAFLAKVEQDINQTDYSNGGEKTSFNMVELFKDGKYTASTDGGPAEENSTITADDIVYYVSEALVENLPSLSDLKSAELTDLGGAIIIEFDLSSAYGDALCKELNKFLYDDETFLTKLASAYNVEALEGYIAFDKFSGLPTAVGTNYNASHTIYGQPYVLQQQIDQNFLLASPNAYEAILETGSPDAEPETDPTPLFYKVTGPNGQTMWLLGTIHVGDNRTGHLPQEIYDAFDSADALAVECDTDAFDQRLEEDDALMDLVSDAYFYADGSTTKDHIEDEELYTYALRMLKVSGNYNFNGLYFKPSVWSSSLDNFYLQQGYQLLSDKGVDHRLLARAREQGKTILEVESSEFQIGMLNGWSEELQELLLLESCSVDYPAYCESTLELYEAWLRGDEAELIEMLSDEVDTSEMTEEELAEYEEHKELLEEYNNAMGPDRNDDMLNVAIEYLESGDTVFYAVGLAHLLGEGGLVFTLRDAGYTVELVPYK